MKMQHARNATGAAGIITTPTHHKVSQVAAHPPNPVELRQRSTAQHPPGLVDGKGSVGDGGVQNLGGGKTLQRSSQVDPVLRGAPQLRGCTAKTWRC